MKKNCSFVVMLVMVLAFGFLLLGCNGKNGKDNSAKTLDDLLEFMSSDFSVTGKGAKAFAMVGAIDGCSVKLDGHIVEIYKYDLKDAGQKTIIDNAKKTNTLSMMTGAIPCVVNGTFVLIGYTNHPEKDKVVSSFQSF